MVPLFYMGWYGPVVVLILLWKLFFWIYVEENVFSEDLKSVSLCRSGTAGGFVDVLINALTLLFMNS